MEGNGIRMILIFDYFETIVHNMWFASLLYIRYKWLNWKSEKVDALRNFEFKNLLYKKQVIGYNIFRNKSHMRRKGTLYGKGY